MPVFVQAMNRKAQSLGMFHSRFEEPTGFIDNNNVSTAHDGLCMVAAAARYPEIRQYSTTAEAEGRTGTAVSATSGNTNAAVKRSDNWKLACRRPAIFLKPALAWSCQARVADRPVVIVLLDLVADDAGRADANRIKRWMSASLATSVERRRV